MPLLLGLGTWVLRSHLNPGLKVSVKGFSHLVGVWEVATVLSWSVQHMELGEAPGRPAACF